MFILYLDFIPSLFKRPANILDLNRFLVYSFLVAVVGPINKNFYLFFIIIIGYYYRQISKKRQ